MKSEGVFEKMGKILKENKILCYALIIAAVITYGYEITNWTLTVDEEIWSHTTKNIFAKGAVGDGRWGIALLKLILPYHKVLPFFNGISAVLILMVCAFLTAYIFQHYIECKAAGVIAALVFLTTPIHSFYLMFDTIAVELAIGCALALLSGYYCMEGCFRRKKALIGASALMLVFSLSIYQSYFMVYVCIVCGILLLDITAGAMKENDQKSIKDYGNTIAVSVCVLIAAALIYAAVNAVVQHFWGKSTYVDDYFRWAYMDVDVCISEIKYYLKLLFFTPSKLFEIESPLAVFYVIYIVEFVWILAKAKGGGRKIIAVLAFVGLNLSICVEYIVMGGSIPLRTLSVIAVYAGLAAFLMCTILRNNICRNAAVICMCVLCLYQASGVVELYYSENVRQEQDMALLNRLLDRIEQLELGDQPDNPIVCVGRHKWNSQYAIYAGQFSTSMFDLGQADRLNRWLTTLGYTFGNATAEQRAEAEDMAKDMPVWPSDGSVAVRDGIIIINFGEE